MGVWKYKDNGTRINVYKDREFICAVGSFEQAERLLKEIKEIKAKKALEHLNEAVADIRVKRKTSAIEEQMMNQPIRKVTVDPEYAFGYHAGVKDALKLKE